MEVFMKSFSEIRYDKLGPKVAKALQARFFEAWYFDNGEEAVEKLFSLIPKEHVISWGGSLTAVGLGVQKSAVERGYEVIDRDAASTREERTELMRKALLCDTYITGTNAISEDGHLVNIDGFGNRVAAMCFGPRQVIVVAGMNKVRKDLNTAKIRAQTIAAPANVQRFPDTKTPCQADGSCNDCKISDSICSYIVTTRLCKPAGRIKIMLIGKDLGL
jgi:hypothetical protein